MKNRQFNRRQFLTISGGAVGAVALASVLASCAPQTGGTNGDKGTAAKLISIGNSEGDPANLDTGMQNTFANLSTVGSACHAYLQYLGADGSLTPDLATEYKLENDTRVVFTLRKGVKFHNGRGMTAKDVVDSYDRVRNADSGSPYVGLLEPIDSIEAVDDLTVAFTLKQAYAPLLALTSQIPIIPIETADTQATAPVGAGPFKFSKWEQDNFMAFTRFEDYYDTSFPRVEEIRFLPRADATALRSGFQSGDVTAITGYAWPEAAGFAGLAGAKTRTEYINGFNFIAFNCRVAPFDDARVRKAFSLALDRDAMAKAANGPEATAASIFIAKTSPYFPKGLEAKFDPSEAKKLLKEAGVPEGFEVEALIPDIPLLRPIEPVWQSLMADVGITLKTQFMPVADYVTRVLVNYDYSIGMLGDSSAPDPALFLDRYLKTAGASNISGYASTQLDELLTNASNTYDDSTRSDLYQQAMEVVLEEAPMLSFIQIPVNIATYPDAEGFDIRPNYLFELREIGA